MQIQSLCWEDLLEEAMATHSSILAWKVPWAEEPGGLRSMRPQSRTRLRDCAQLRRSGKCLRIEGNAEKLIHRSILVTGI